MYLSLLITTLSVSFLWSISPILYKILLNDIHLSTILILIQVVLLIISCIYGLYHWEHIVTDVNKLNIKNISWIVIAGASLCLGQLLYLYALKHYKAYIVAALCYTSPIFTMLLAYLVLNETISLQCVIGVITIVIGVILLTCKK